ncbi:hypothetical protein QR685DRAFT_199730 [Neurospora intermedia]|uniref:Uncharacterized protein n=1 Tax=Neurospora intermedia TaxID=5142 RepID=A0ABR3DF46_NEUIN
MAPKKSVKDIYDIPSDDEDDENTPLVKVKTHQRPMPPTAPPSRIGASKDGLVVGDSLSEGERPLPVPKRSARQRSRLVIDLPQRKAPPSDVEIVDVDGDQDHNSPVEAVPEQSVNRVKKKRPARKSTSSSKFVDRGDSSTPPESDDEADGQQGGRITARTFTAHLSVEMVEPTREFLKALPDHKSRAHTWVRKYKTGAVNMDILNNEILPWVPCSEDWTEEDHKRIRRKWRDDSTRDKQIETKTNKDIQTLTKTCLLFFRCLPEHILSRNDMEYDFGQNSTSKDGEQTLIWSAPFCKEMHALLPHAMFAGDIKLLATALQYIVMVETDDRRCWPMATPVWDEFPKQMQALSRAQGTSQSRRSIVKIRKEVKSNGQQAGYAPSHWNMLFERIEQLLEKAAKKKTKSQIPDRAGTLSEDPFQP